jgi:hypothetical protein
MEVLEGRVVPSGTFTALAHAASYSSNTMLLATDGGVLMEGGGVSNTWYRLTPSTSGSYIQGTWSQVASMSLRRLYYRSNVLPDGRVLVLGGEYSGILGQQNLLNQGEIYDPVANTWSSIAPYPAATFGDDPTAMLPGGWCWRVPSRVRRPMAAGCFPLLAGSRYNAVTNTVTLMPLRTLSLSSPAKLRIIASALDDALGRPFDGNDDGQPGGDFVAPLHKAR